MLGEALEAAGIARGDYVVRINNRKVLNGVLEAAGCSIRPIRSATPPRRGIVMRRDRQARPARRGRCAGAARRRAARRERGLHRRAPGSATSRRQLILGFMAARAGDARGDLRAAARARGRLARSASTACRSSRRSPSCWTARGAPAVDRSLGGARARLLHRAGLRGGADLRGGRRRRAAAAVRLGGRRRALRRPRASASPARRCRRPASRSASTGCWRRSARRGGWPRSSRGRWW